MPVLWRDARRCSTPCNNDQLLTIANERYNIGLDTQTQIVNRRGWLQSAGMVVSVDDGKIEATAAGLALLTELTLHNYPATGSTITTTIVEAPSSEVVVEPAPSEVSIVDGIIGVLEDSATDSSHADRFEYAVRDAFAYLGFQAERLGELERPTCCLTRDLERWTRTARSSTARPAARDQSATPRSTG